MSGSIVSFPLTLAPARRTVPSLGARARALLSAMIGEWRLRRDLAALQSMDTRGLKDIGLTRGSLEGAVRFGRRPGGFAENWPERISAAPEWPPVPSSWTEWR